MLALFGLYGVFALFWFVWITELTARLFARVFGLRGLTAQAKQQARNPRYLRAILTAEEEDSEPSAFHAVFRPILESPAQARKRRLGIVLAIGAAYGILVVVVWTGILVNERAAKSARGETVEPVKFFGLRFLDVESRPCTADWIGARPGDAPTALRSAEVHCIGSSNSIAIFRNGSSTVMVPSNEVVITLK